VDLPRDVSGRHHQIETGELSAREVSGRLTRSAPGALRTIVFVDMLTVAEAA
jgi:hypothetical protein